MRGLIISAVILFAALASISAVSAAVCTNDNQIIMRLSSPPDNAHGAVWNYQGYGIKVCYNDIFGFEFTGSNPHGCTSSSTALRLYSANNSHAASKEFGNYTTSICYKGLENCTIHSGKACTKADKRVIVYLSSLTNAHLSKSYFNGSYAVCCSNTTSGVVIAAGPTYCFDYTTKNSCGNDTYGIAQVGCPAGKTCFCEWNATASKCMQSYELPPTPECPYYKCTFTPRNYLEAPCINGYKTVSISAQIVYSDPQCAGVVDANCIDKEAEIPCGVIEPDLPFFGAWQLAASLVGIFLVYLVLRKRL